MKTIPRFILCLCAATLVLTGCKKESLSATHPADNITETLPAIQTAVTAAVSSQIGGFYRALPAGYDATAKKYPLLVFLHGANETGNGTTDLSRLLADAVPGLLNQHLFPAQFTVNGQSYSFIVISPQFTAWPQAADVDAMIDYAQAHYRVDESRIYIIGQSMGGGIAWDYAMAHPRRIAAVVPISGASWSSKEALGSIAKANLPVWAFHNSGDSTVEAATTLNNTQIINEFQPAIAARTTIWTSAGHDAWTKATNPATRACNGKNIYEWMLQYTRPITH